ncbi:DNA damage-inducible transcript 4 protein [Emydura macquarii macquarii]|uniref:DNA damage-inducible transcript 4 protein n=1 Tax=Emydura macquarii macquarii TaxID=1129001 RepID=UPI00352AB4E6
MPGVWDSFSCSLPAIPEQRENQPSPTFSWGKSWQQEGPDRCPRMESSDCESLDSSLSCGDTEYLDEVSLPDLDLLNDPEDELLCNNLMKLIQVNLNKANINSKRCSRLVMPSQLITQVSKELLHLAYSEPCGLRGALIDLCVEHGKGCHSVGQIEVDPSLVPTFQLTLVLRLDSRLWPKIQGLFSSGPSFTPGFSQSLKLSTGFRVIKKKLYSSEQLLIEEC